MNALEKFKAFEHKTFGDAAALYAAELSGPGRERQIYALRAVLPYIEDVPLMELTDESLWEYKNQRLKEVMPGTVQKEIVTVRTVLNRAARDYGWLPYVPIIQNVPGPRRKSYPLTRPQERKLLRHLRGNVRRICLFVLNTGVLRSEVFELRWENEKEINGIEYFLMKRAGNGQVRPIVLNSVAKRVVKQMEGANDELVFPIRDVAKAINRAWVKAGLPDHKLIRKGINNLRYTFANRLRLAGATDQEREAMLGLNAHGREQQYAVLDFERLAKLAEATITVEEPDLPVYYQAN